MGVLRLKRFVLRTVVWWSIISIFVSVVFLCSSLFSFSEFSILRAIFYSAINLVWNGVIISYFTRPKTKEAFSEKFLTENAKRESISFGIAGFVLGVTSIFGSFVFGSGIFIAIAGFICSFIQLKKRKDWTAIMGLVLSIMGILLSLAVISFSMLFFQMFG